MKIFDKISMCMRNLWRRKMRTALTVFGVVIGTCAIVVMVSLGVGMDKAQTEMIEGMGNLTLIQVYPDYGMSEGPGGVVKEPPKLNAESVKKLRAIPGVKAATAMQYLWGDEVVFQVDERYRYRGQIIGIDIASMPALGYTLADGRFPTKSEYKDAVIIGAKVPYQFVDTKRKRDNRVSPYPDQYGRVKDPFVDFSKDRLYANIGKQDDDDDRSGREKVPTGNGSYPVKVVGTLSSDDEAMNRDFDMEYAIYMDIDRVQALQKEYNKKNKVRGQTDQEYQQVYVMADSLDSVDEVQDSIKALGFQYWSLSSQREEMQKSTQTIQMILGGLAGISLLVAALGITNTMIMSIYERTREIGIMKVLGCEVGNICSIFLMEAGCIGLLGGLVGVGISYAISFGLNFIMNNAAMSGDGSGMGGMMGGMLYGWDQGGMTQYSIIPPWLVAGAMVFAICIGLFSGFYPANRAVKISALEAIKHE